MFKNFNNINENFLSYGGNGGNKKSFTKENGEKWFLKFPKTTRDFNNVDISYTTSPISEYIGSQIYNMLSFPVHETELGIYQDKIVVACKDFIPSNARLCEMKNIFNDDLGKNEKERENLKSSTEHNYRVDIEEISYVFKNNTKVKIIPNAEERFWDMFVIDCFINNNDRHNGNWGILVDNTKGTLIDLAPVYDNGNSFFPKHDEEKMIKILNNNKQTLLNGATPYLYKEKNIDSVKVIRNLSLRDNNLNFGNSEEDKFLKDISNNLQKAILRNVPKIDMEKINKIIDEIPEEYNGIKVMSSLMKNFYKTFLNERYEQILLPALEKVKKIELEKNKLENPLEKEKPANPWAEKLKKDKDNEIER